MTALKTIFQLIQESWLTHNCLGMENLRPGSLKVMINFNLDRLHKVLLGLISLGQFHFKYLVRAGTLVHTIVIIRLLIDLQSRDVNIAVFGNALSVWPDQFAVSDPCMR